MKKKFFLFLHALFFLSMQPGIAQNSDSLWQVYRNVKNPDTMRLEAFNDIAWNLLFTNPDSAYLLGHQELEKATALKLPKWESKALNTIGASYQVRGNFVKAIEFYQQSLKIRETMGDVRGASSSMANIGSIYISIGEFRKALYYQEKSLKIFESIGNKEGMASALNNLGVIYNNLSDQKKALDYNFRSLQLYEELGDKQGVAACHDNIGVIHFNMGQYDKALQHQQDSYKGYEATGDKGSGATILAAIGRTYLKQKRYDLALENTLKGKKLSVEVGNIIAEREASSVLYEIYKATGKKDLALQNYEHYIILKDSILKEENQRAINNKELQYEYEKKAAADSVKHEEEKRVKDALIDARDAKIEQDKTQKWALFGGLCLLMVSGGIMYNRFRIIRRQKKVIEIKNRETEEQKEIIEAKQKEILASISYAKRLQEAILPPQRMIKKLLPDSFILYQPKDIVAGDFYWVEHVGDWTLFAAADCTGHGVPGALVSVVCSNALNRAVKEFHIIEPGKILDKVLELVLETFEKSESEVNDGMDISLCAYNKKTNELNWAGANNPLWIIRNRQLIEHKANKQAIGKTETPVSYTTHQLSLQAGDLIYVFTDGYADQFGGNKGKKFNYKNLQAFLMKNASLPLAAQEAALLHNLREWKGGLEQVDDILIVGIKI